MRLPSKKILAAIVLVLVLTVTVPTFSTITAKATTVETGIRFFDAPPNVGEDYWPYYNGH